MNRCLTIPFLLLFISIAAHPARAQQQSGESLLPEISPQDIEIRSQFQANFPNLHRQPILGFDRTPSIYKMDPDRKPYMETPEQVVASIPISKQALPTPPVYTPFYYGNDMNAYGQLGLGSYASPEIKAWAGNHLNPQTYLSGNLNFSSSNGHLDDQPSGFRYFNLDAKYAAKLSNQTRLDLNAGIQDNFNHMMELNPSINQPAGAKKTYTGVHFGGQIERFKNAVAGWRLRANIHSFEASLDTDSGTNHGNEVIYDLSGLQRWTGAHPSETFTANLGLKGSHYNNPVATDNWLTAKGGAAYHRLFNYSTDFSLGLDVYYASDAYDNNFYLGPSVKFKQPFLDIFTLTLKGGAKPYVKTLQQLHSYNRFLNTKTNPQHSYDINGLAKLDLEYSQVGTLTFGLKYNNISDYPVFMRQSADGHGSAPFRYYQTDYMDVYKINAFASVTHQIAPRHFWVNAKMYVQSPQIQNGGRIPYAEKFGFHSGFGVRPFNKLTVKAWGDYTGSRRTFQKDEKLGGYFLLGGRTDFAFTHGIGIYAKVKNLLSQHYQLWQGYTERPFQIYGGVTIKF